MAERNKLASITGQPLPERQGNFLSDLWDEAKGSFARYGRRSGAQRDASLAMLNQAVDPNTDPLTGAGMKALGLAGLVTHPLAFFPTGDEWRERLSNAGNDSRIGQAIGGMLGDLPSVVDPHLLAGGGALAMAPLASKLMNKADDVADAGITAYHGSPHSFDKFSLDYMGTGHGKQQEGKGLYLTSEPTLGERYRANHAHKSPEAIAEKYLANWGADAEAKLSEFATKRASEMRPEAVEPYNKALEILRTGADTSRKGRVYETRINARADEILDLTNPSAARPDITDPMSMTAETAKKHGIKVLAYDAASESGVRGAKNYVVFDPSVITILKKYGIPMTAGAGGAMMVAGQDMPPEFAAQMGGT